MSKRRGKAIDKKLSQPTWNYRLVRRHEKVLGGRKELTWLSLTEVHYHDGKPNMFARAGSVIPLQASDELEEIVHLRDTLDRMRTALDQPILDELTDFKREEKV